MIDLHMHTVFSDGASQPEDLVNGAITHGLQAIAVTDHDNTESYQRVCQAAEGKPLEIIPGIEINTVHEGKEVHVLGYYFQPGSPEIAKICKKHREARLTQLSEMVSKVAKKAKVSMTFEDVLALSKTEGTLGRPHIAQLLVSKGACKTIGDAFAKYLNSEAPTYVRRETASPHEAAEAIYESGGIAVIAHPGEMLGIEDLVKDMMNYGLRGLEAYHKSHSPAAIEFHSSLAEKYGLVVTGGTDYHGNGDSYVSALARFYMPDAVFGELKAERDRIQRSQIKVS